MGRANMSILPRKIVKDPTRPMNGKVKKKKKKKKKRRIAQVAAALLAHRAPVTTELGIIPMGTANDFATGLGIPTDPWEALQLTLSSPAQPIDVGMVNDEVGGPSAPFLQAMPILHSLWPPPPPPPQPAAFLTRKACRPVVWLNS